MDGTDNATFMFTHLVLMLHGAAMQHMGKLKNPLSEKVERDLRAAQGMIDLLAMLKVRTKGNLTEEEARMLDQVLQELRLNYVDEANKPDPTPAAEGTPAP